MGFVNGDTEASPDTAPGYSTSAGPTSGVDSYTVTPGAAADVNYTISYVSGMLEILPAPLTISAVTKHESMALPIPRSPQPIWDLSTMRTRRFWPTRLP